MKLLRKYLLRRDFFSRVNHKRLRMQRRITKNSFRDQKRLLGEASTIFDVGANVGDVAGRYLRLFPGSAVICFEPFPEVAELLTRRFSDCSRVSVEPYALSDSRGTKTLYVSETSVMNSLHEPLDFPRWGFDPQNTISVTAETLDDYCAENNVRSIDILKMDVQGSEFEILTGASNLLAENRIELVYTEWQIVPFYQGQHLQQDLTVFLKQYDYSLFNIYGLVESKLGQARWGDAVFISPMLRARLEDKFGKVYCGW